MEAVTGRIGACNKGGEALVTGGRMAMRSMADFGGQTCPTLFRVSNVFQTAIVENTQGLPISVGDEHALVMNTGRKFTSLACGEYTIRLVNVF